MKAYQESYEAVVSLREGGRWDRGLRSPLTLAAARGTRLCGPFRRDPGVHGEGPTLSPSAVPSRCWGSYGTHCRTRIPPV